nr:probable LRR receptor-like serine/threonine-protein kinase At1g06840 isoform X2 [Tanacetum cinerariifolium]
MCLYDTSACSCGVQMVNLDLRMLGGSMNIATEQKRSDALLLTNGMGTERVPSSIESMHIPQLDNNQFDGDIPSFYGNLSALVKISLRNCSLRGALPDLSGLKNLCYMNSLTGSIASKKLSDNMTTMHNYKRTSRFCSANELAAPMAPSAAVMADAQAIVAARFNMLVP